MLLWSRPKGQTSFRLLLWAFRVLSFVTLATEKKIPSTCPVLSPLPPVQHMQHRLKTHSLSCPPGEPTQKLPTEKVLNQFWGGGEKSQDFHFSRDQFIQSRKAVKFLRGVNWVFISIQSITEHSGQIHPLTHPQLLVSACVLCSIAQRSFHGKGTARAVHTWRRNDTPPERKWHHSSSQGPEQPQECSWPSVCPPALLGLRTVHKKILNSKENLRVSLSF